MAENAQNMLDQVESLPDLIRSEFDRLDANARRLLNHNECLSVKRIVITGCGDSYMAGLATELCFEQLAKIPTEPMSAMQAARYGAPNFDHMFPRNPLVVGVSVSGTVARTREAVAMARKEGALTVALTGDPDAPLGRAAERIFDCKIPPFVPAPGVRSYRISLLALYLLAIRLAEVSGRLTQAQGAAMREELKGTADLITATIKAVNGRTRELAEAVANQKEFVFIGDGPNYATGLFSAAKVIEAAGRHAMGQDTEEWAHLQYFVNVDPATPTWLISPGGRGHARAAELVPVMKRIGRTVVAVVPEGDQAIAPGADWILPVPGKVPEMFSPMVYAVAGELFAAHLSAVTGEPPFRGFSGAYEDGGNTIKTSAVIDSLSL
ncbi:MAG: SIS domain-containing protein [Herpetosiphonaceae bacterium]|nr:SIS domain-containing protein [Herpetosiphonaceae bacterium]